MDSKSPALTFFSEDQEEQPERGIKPRLERLIKNDQSEDQDKDNDENLREQDLEKLDHYKKFENTGIN